MDSPNANAYWHARSIDFVATGITHLLEWSRIPGDALIIVGGTLPLVYLALQAVFHPKPVLMAPERA